MKPNHTVEFKIKHSIDNYNRDMETLCKYEKLYKTVSFIIIPQHSHWVILLVR